MEPGIKINTLRTFCQDVGHYQWVTRNQRCTLIQLFVQSMEEATFT